MLILIYEYMLRVYFYQTAPVSADRVARGGHFVLTKSTNFRIFFLQKSETLGYPLQT